MLLEKSPLETLHHFEEAYGDHAMKISTVYDWHNRFTLGREGIHDDDRKGRP